MRLIKTLLGKFMFGGFPLLLPTGLPGDLGGNRVDDDACTDSGLECGLKDFLLGAHR